MILAMALFLNLVSDTLSPSKGQGFRAGFFPGRATLKPMLL